MDRAVNIISPKKWRLVGSWKGALKYEVGTIMFAANDDKTIFAASHNVRRLPPARQVVH